MCRKGFGQNCISEEGKKKMEPGSSVMHDRRTRDNRLKFKEKKFTWDIRKSCFTPRAAKRWDRLASVFESFACLEGFKILLDKALSWI